MRVIIDFDDPVNDLELVGVAAGSEPGTLFGRNGTIIWRLFSAAVRTLFLARQSSEVATDALNREWTFIEERIREYRRATGGQMGQNGGKRR